MANGPKKELWGSEHQHSLRFHNFADIINDEQNLYFWLKGDDKFVTLSVIKFMIWSISFSKILKLFIHQS